MNAKTGNTVLKILLPIAFLAVAVVFTVTIILLRKEPEKKEITKVLPRVEVITVKSEPLSLSVESQGTVENSFLLRFGSPSLDRECRTFPC